MIIVIILLILCLCFFIIWIIFRKKVICNNNPFGDKWNDTKLIRNDLIKNTYILFNKLNIEFFLINQTLLGSVKYKGHIQWIDSIDIAISKTNFDKLSQMDLDNLFLTKINKKLYKIHKRDTSWPCIDIYYFETTQNDIIIPLENIYKKYNKSEVFPLEYKLFNNINLPIPKNYKNILNLLYPNYQNILYSDIKYDKRYMIDSVQFEQHNNMVMDKLFDNVYIINLDSKPDRYNISKNRLEEIGITPKKWKAVDSSHKDIITKYNMIQHENTTINEFACHMSHEQLWQYLYDKNIQYSIIFEDDLIFNNLTKEDIIYEIKNHIGFDILLLGHCISSNTSNITKPGYAKCLNAYVVSHSALKKLLENISINYKTPIDHIVNKMCKDDLLCFLSKTQNKLKKYFGNGLIFQDRENLKSTNKRNYMCIKCLLPDNFFFYVLLLLGIIIIIIISIIMYNKFKKTKKLLDSCRSSCQ